MPLFLIIALSIILSFFSAVPARAHNELQLEKILAQPTNEEIDEECILRNITPHSHEIVKTIIENILNGDTSFLSNTTHERSSTENPKNDIQLAFPFSSYEAAFTALRTGWKSLRSSFSFYQKDIDEIDTKIKNSSLFSIALHFSKKRVLELLYVSYSPHAASIERTQALFHLTKANLPGTLGIAFARLRNYLNRFYFAKDGSLLEFDPSRRAIRDPKRIIMLNKFLKIISINKQEYLGNLKKALDYRIHPFAELYQKALDKRWIKKGPSKIVHFTSLLIKQITSLDIRKTIEPSVILNNLFNRNFLTLTKLCEVSLKNIENWPATFRAAHSFVELIEKKHHGHTCSSAALFRQYYHAAYQRFFIEEISTVFKNDPLAQNITSYNDNIVLMERLLTRRKGRELLEKEFCTMHRSPETNYLLSELGERWFLKKASGESFQSFLYNDLLSFLTNYAVQHSQNNQALTAYKSFFDRNYILKPLSKDSSSIAIAKDIKNDYQKIKQLNRDIMLRMG